MRPPKNPKKSPDKDRSGKKKIKSKSAKRRRDPSFSSDSSSSESEIDSRSRRKSSKSKKLDKRRKESKKSERRKGRKKRYRRDSSVSSFSDDSGRRSCSTCSDSEMSESPVRKSKSRKRERERGRKSSRRRPKRLESSRSGRHRSRSSSTCSRTWGHSRSRSRSPIERRFGSKRRSNRSRSHSRSPIEGRYGSSRPSPPVEESPTIKERFGSSHRWSRCKDERETQRLRSVIAVTKTSDEDEDKIIEAYDDYPQNNKGYDDEGNKKRNLDVGIKEKDLYDTRIREEVTSSEDRGQLVKDSDAGGDATKKYSMKKESEVVGEDDGEEADDLELILRQKALENFKKFRGVRPANKESFSDKKDESSKLESCQGSQSFMKTSESNPRSSLDDQRHVQGGGIDPNKLKARSVANIPTEKIDGNAARDLSNDTGDLKPVDHPIANQDTLNQFKRVHESSDKISSEESSLPKDSQNKKIVSLPDNGKISRAEIDTFEKPASDALNVENQNCKANEPMVEPASGSQFEQKTFSRVCDGETVQVSYKVYIPKKTPALARRQLQR